MELGTTAAGALDFRSKSKLLVVRNEESDSSDSEPAAAAEKGTPSLLRFSSADTAGVEYAFGLPRAAKDFRSRI